jgi:hypothetical protein
MRIPFEMLMEYASILRDTGAEEKSMGELAAAVGEPVDRLADAIDAVRVLRGERTYIPVPAPSGC